MIKYIIDIYNIINNMSIINNPTIPEFSINTKENDYIIKLLVEKLYYCCYDNNIRNNIISAVFKYLYENSINTSEIPSMICLSYQLKSSEINICTYLINTYYYDLIHVKNRYNSDRSIYIYYNKYINKYFNINIIISTSEVDTVSEIYII